MRADASMCLRMLAYAGICWRMLLASASPLAKCQIAIYGDIAISFVITCKSVNCDVSSDHDIVFQLASYSWSIHGPYTGGISYQSVGPLDVNDGISICASCLALYSYSCCEAPPSLLSFLMVRGFSSVHLFCVFSRAVPCPNNPKKAPSMHPKS